MEILNLKLQFKNGETKTIPIEESIGFPDDEKHLIIADLSNVSRREAHEAVEFLTEQFADYPVKFLFKSEDIDFKPVESVNSDERIKKLERRLRKLEIALTNFDLNNPYGGYGG